MIIEMTAYASHTLRRGVHSEPAVPPASELRGGQESSHFGVQSVSPHLSCPDTLLEMTVKAKINYIAFILYSRL